VPVSQGKSEEINAIKCLDTAVSEMTHDVSHCPTHSVALQNNKWMSTRNEK